MPELQPTSPQRRNQALGVLRFLPSPDFVKVLRLKASIPLRTRFPPVGIDAGDLQSLCPLFKATAVQTPHVVNLDLTKQLRLQVDPMVTCCRAAIDQNQHGAGCSWAPEGVSTPAASLFMG